MADLVDSLFKRRTYPFIFTLLVLLICVSLLLFSNSASTSTFNRVIFYPDVKGQPSSTPTVAPITIREDQGLPRKVTPVTIPKDEELPRNENPITTPKDEELPLNENPITVPNDVPQNEIPITEPKDQGLSQNEIPITEPKDQGLPLKEEAIEIVTADVKIDWKLCKGPLATDNIPCLDNLVAIKALKSRRHMEHRERHCPDPSPRCLVPLPKGYKVPVPWPKSRDMVRLILR